MGYLFDPDNWEWVTSGNNLRFLLEGFLINLEIAAIAMVLSLIFGLLLALGRLSKLRPLGLAAGVWVDIWRNLPLIFIILYLFLAAPESWSRTWEDNAPGFLPEALQSGRGLTYPQQLRYVILPQGLRRMVPATVSQLITLNKDTTLVSIIAIQEVVRHGRTLSSGFTAFVGGVQAPVLQVFIFIGLLFVVPNFILSRLSRRLEIRERKRTGGTAGPVIGLEDQTALAAEAR